MAAADLTNTSARLGKHTEVAVSSHGSNTSLERPEEPLPVEHAKQPLATAAAPSESVPAVQASPLSEARPAGVGEAGPETFPARSASTVRILVLPRLPICPGGKIEHCLMLIGITFHIGYSHLCLLSSHCRPVLYLEIEAGNCKTNWGQA